MGTRMGRHANLGRSNLVVRRGATRSRERGSMRSIGDVPVANIQLSDNPQLVDDPCLFLSVFGNMSVTFLEQELKIRNRKSRALLAFLALSDNVWETREKIIGLFWSESDERKGQASLRHALRELREIFLGCGFSGMHTEKLAVRLDRRMIKIDLGKSKGKSS